MKKLFVSLLATLCLGVSVACSVPITYGARAEEEITETIESTGVIVEETKTSIVDEISQTAKDTIAVIKEVFNQPVVIGGVSTTIGAILIFILYKVIGGNATKKKIKELLGKITDLSTQMLNSVSRKEYSALKGQFELLYKVLVDIAPTIKNVNVRNNVFALLDEVKVKAVDPTVEFAKTETEKVVIDSKDYVNSKAQEIADIINKD